MICKPVQSPEPSWDPHLSSALFRPWRTGGIPRGSEETSLNVSSQTLTSRGPAPLLTQWGLVRDLQLANHRGDPLAVTMWRDWLMLWEIGLPTFISFPTHRNAMSSQRTMRKWSFTYLIFVGFKVFTGHGIFRWRRLIPHWITWTRIDGVPDFTNYPVFNPCVCSVLVGLP